MSGKQFVFSLLFKGDNASAKAAAREVEQGLDAVEDQARQTTASLKGNAETLEQEARSARKAADAARDLALAEKQVRDQAAKAQGAQVAPITLDPKRAEELRERFVPLVAAQKTYAKDLEQIALAERAGALTAMESAAARTRLKTSHDAEVAAIQRSSGALDAHNKVVKLSSHERRILNMQLSDTAQSLALGMPPLQVLLQQGPQITDLYGGVGHALRAAAAALTPMRLAVAGIAAVAVTGAVSWNGYLQSVKEVDTAAAGLGRGMAGTRQEMEAAARAGAEAAGLSVKAARSMEAAFLRTGRIDSTNFEGLIGLSKDFAATIGADAAAAGAALSEIFADPDKGADILFRQYGLISGATAQLAKDLTAQNRQAEAQAVLIKALPANLADAEEATTALGRAWDYVARKASDAGGAIGGAINRVFEGPTLEEQIAEVRARLDSAKGNDWSRGIFGDRTGGVYAGAYDQDVELLADLTREKRGRDEAAALERQRAEDRRKTAAALTISEKSPANAAYLREQQLRNEMVALEGARNASGISDDQRASIDRSIEAKARALDGLANRQAYQNTLDRIGIQLAAERNPLRQAELVLMQTMLGSADKEITWAEASAEAMRARNRVMGEAMGAAQAQSADMRVEMEIRQRLNMQVSAGIITAEEANRLLREEIELHPLVAAAAEANGKEQADLNKIIAERRALSAELAHEEKRAQATEALIDYGKAQAEQLDRLRLEASLIGATDRERARALAAHEAEVELRRRSTEITAGQIAQARDQAEAMADYRAEVGRLADAWDSVESAAGSAIDGMVDGLLGGDLSDALRSIGQEAIGLVSELSLKNPLKNAILGSDLPTMADVGGVSGILGRLFGGGSAEAAQLSVSTMSAASMAVTTPVVQITAGSISGQMPGGAGGLGYAGGMAGGLPGSGDVQGQIWQFFLQRGLQPHQIAAILGNASAESGFNPLAVGDGGTSFGLFQHHAGRGQALLDYVGGREGLSNIQAQLEFVWQELLSGENGVLKRLQAAPNVHAATQAFVGYERPAGWSGANPTGAMHWDRRLAGAEAAMAKFEGTTASAQTQLGQLGTGAAQLGTGLQNFGANLAGTLQGIGASYGPGGAFVGGLLGAGLKWLTGASFEIGGYTGSGATTDVAGVVHAEEYVFDAAATRRIGVSNLEAIRRGAMRGYREGGYVVGGQPPVPARASGGAEAGGAARGGGAGAPHTFNINVTGTGNQEVREGVLMAIEQAFDTYDRNVFAGRVRMVVNDQWSG